MIDPIALGIAVAVAWAIFAGFMFVAWIIQQRSGNSGWVDVCWTLGLATSTLVALALGGGSGTGRTWLVAAFLSIWAARLAWYLVVRTRKITDDPRYARMNEEFGADAPRKMFWLLQAQAALCVPLVLTVVIAASNANPFPTVLDGLGLIVFVVGVVGSTASDAQLARFKADPANKGKVCDVGLWAWSRHPNYFFEAVIWSAYLPLALAPAAVLGWSTLAIAGPVAIVLLLRFVSGVPPLEDHMRARYGAAFAAYEARTSAFLPRPPRRS